VGGGIWPFSEKLHETGNGTLGEYHAVFCELCENWVSGLYKIPSHDLIGRTLKLGEKS